MIKVRHLLLAALVTGGLGVAIAALGGDRSLVRKITAATQLPLEGKMPSLDHATEWINSEPLTAEGLRGKVVLVDFGTYTCINWLRAFPYVRAWREKYRGQGLVVITVHAPEFPFEKNLENVRRAVKEMRIDHPVAVDNDHAIWRAFDNQYWPALYLVDARGNVRHHQFGEGGYERSERVIQELLAEAGASVDRGLVSPTGRGTEAPAAWETLKSPENYLGHGRTANFDSPGGIARNRRYTYGVPERLRLNHWALDGDWTVAQGASLLNARGGRIVYRFHARDLHLVMGPATAGAPVRFRVLIDGEPPGAAHGLDTDAQGNGTVTGQRLYQLIRQRGPIQERTFEITFYGPGVEAYAFTFG